MKLKYLIVLIVTILLCNYQASLALTSGPVIEILNEIVVEQNETLHLELYVKATDVEDGNITDKIIIQGDYDLSTKGRYNVELFVVDSDGNSISYPIAIEVVSRPISNLPIGIGLLILSLFIVNRYYLKTKKHPRNN